MPASTITAASRTVATVTPRSSGRNLAPGDLTRLVGLHVRTQHPAQRGDPLGHSLDVRGQPHLIERQPRCDRAVLRHAQGVAQRRSVSTAGAHQGGVATVRSIAGPTFEALR